MTVTPFRLKALEQEGIVTCHTYMYAVSALGF